MQQPVFALEIINKMLMPISVAYVIYSTPFLLVFHLMMAFSQNNSKSKGNFDKPLSADNSLNDKDSPQEKEGNAMRCSPC
ncbi:MAG: hypothetical protein EBY16_01855 [Gammaproteobacteria bacterium]|nr:hypothetical protein [Gammaproteobacteria bacterium]